MLKTQWKVWKDTRFYHKIWVRFPHFIPEIPHILGFGFEKKCDFPAESPRYAFTFLMISLTVSRRC